MINDVLNDVKEGMDNSITSLNNDLGIIRTGRASSSLVNKLQVEYYGTPTPLIQLALISVPEPQLIAIRPFDPASIKDIERAILKSDLGINPGNDGKIIRLPIPPLTEERRRDLAKQVHKRVEDAKISVRNQRRDGISYLQDLEKEKEISEDDFHKGKDEVQKLTDKFIKKIDKIGKAKEDEIMSI